MIHRRRGEGIVVGVAGIAGCRRWYMGGRFAQRIRAIVASRASAGHYALVVIRGWLPSRGGVARIAGLGGWNVSRRFGLGIDRYIAAVMAGCTVASGRWPGRSAVAHDAGSKRGKRRMTGIALRGGWNVIGRLAKGVRAVVAGGATARHGWC